MSGFICTLRCCRLDNTCPGEHYYYYNEPNDDLIAIFINDTIKYISRPGFHVYYERQLAQVSEQAEEFQASCNDERPSKRRRMY